MQGQDECPGTCQPDNACFNCYRTTPALPGVYVVDATLSKQPKRCHPKVLLNTVTTVNARGLNLLRTDGSVGVPSIQMLEKVHVCSLTPDLKPHWIIMHALST